MITEEKFRENFAKRLDLACKEKGLAEWGRGAEIAKILGVTPKAVSKWFSGETTPSPSKTYALAKYLGVTPEWLTFGDQNVVPANVKKSHSYPLISSIQAGTWTDACDFHDSIGYDYIDTEIDAGEGAFFLRISGLSMEPKFSEGDLVLIDIRKRPHPGDFVAAVNGNGEATLKRYRELGEISESGNPHFELVPLNPDFPTLSSMKQEIRIIGVAVEHRSYL